MAYNADNHRMMLPAQARGVGMVTVRNTGLCQDAESRLRRMMRNPEKNRAAGATSYKARKRVAIPTLRETVGADGVRREGGRYSSVHSIPMLSAAQILERKLSSLSRLEQDAMVAKLANA